MATESDGGRRAKDGVRSFSLKSWMKPEKEYKEDEGEEDSKIFLCHTSQYVGVAELDVFVHIRNVEYRVIRKYRSSY